MPAKTFPFQVGDELVSVDGTSVSDWIKTLQPYTVNGSANAVSRNRLAVATLLDRFQGWYPFASKTGATASVVINTKTGPQTFTINWQSFGTPLSGIGAIPDPRRSSAISPAEAQHFRHALAHHGRLARNVWGINTESEPALAPEKVPDYLAPLEKLRYMGAKLPNVVGGSLAPFGAKFPVFAPPAGFTLRLGAKSADQFLSGTFPLGKLNIGFIRIPSMSPSNQNNALNQFLAEMIFFQQNTDGMVIDVMGNGGGSICYTNTLLQMLNPKPFRELGFQLRGTQFWITSFSSALTSAKLTNAPQYVIDLYTAYLAEILEAQAGKRGDTGALPLCGVSFENVPPLKDSTGASVAYTKPIAVLTDNFTLSAGELFAATLQDANRATVYGTRTDGGGGSVVEFDTAPYSEGLARVTMSLAIRAQPITTPGFPAVPLIENLGVFPDVAADYMTVDNLNKNGATFVKGFTALITNLITQGHP